MACRGCAKTWGSNLHAARALTKQNEDALLKKVKDVLKIWEKQGHVWWWRDDITAIPNKIYNKAGFPDVFIMRKKHDRIQIYLIELKRDGKAQYTPGQKELLQFLDGTNVMDSTYTDISFHRIDDYDSFLSLFPDIVEF